MLLRKATRTVCIRVDEETHRRWKEIVNEARLRGKKAGSVFRDMLECYERFRPRFEVL